MSSILITENPKQSHIHTEAIINSPTQSLGLVTYVGTTINDNKPHSTTNNTTQTLGGGGGGGKLESEESFTFKEMEREKHPTADRLNTSRQGTDWLNTSRQGTDWLNTSRQRTDWLNTSWIVTCIAISHIIHVIAHGSCVIYYVDHVIYTSQCAFQAITTGVNKEIMYYIIVE